jgi:hypothetical protein
MSSDSDSDCPRPGPIGWCPRRLTRKEMEEQKKQWEEEKKEQEREHAALAPVKEYLFSKLPIVLKKCEKADKKAKKNKDNEYITFIESSNCAIHELYALIHAISELKKC